MTAPTQSEVYELAKSKGWHDRHAALMQFLRSNNAPSQVIDHAEACWVAARLALIAAEVSEALELVRDDQMYSPEWHAELADIGLRLKDLAEDTGVDLAAAEATKHEKNKTRTHMHGGKSL